MIYTIIDVQLLLIVISLFIVYNYKPCSIDHCLIFITLTVVHNSIDAVGLLDGGSYYTSAGSFNLLTIIILNKLKPTAIGYYLQLISFIALITNFIGYLFWFSYLSHIAYSVAFIIIYFSVIYVMLNRTSDRKHGILEINNDGAIIYSNGPSGHKCFKRSKIKAAT